MNHPRTLHTVASLLFGLGAVIALAGEPAAAVAPATLANAEKIPRLVITAKRLTAEQKAAVDKEEGRHQGRRFANEKSPQKGAKASGDVG